MNRWREYYNFHKRNPIEFYESYLGVKFNRFQKVKLRLSYFLSNYLYSLLLEENKILKEMLIESYGTTRYDVLKLHSVVLELKISIVKSVLKV